MPVWAAVTGFFYYHYTLPNGKSKAKIPFGVKKAALSQRRFGLLGLFRKKGHGEL